ncbi:hypothetical protein P7C73_g2467, partial [Tremellales sp. Uapishka_1]
MGFEVTEYETVLVSKLSAVGAGVSLAMCLAVLLSSLWIWSKPHARPTLDRISFRLLLWSLGWEVVYDIAYIYLVLGIGPENAMCSSTMYFVIAAMGVVNCLCTCIAINLMLTITFGLNPIALRLERWYLGVSMFVGLVVPIAPTALGHFGWDPILITCWFKGSDHDTRMKHFVSDLYIWQILCCLIASGTVIATLATLYRQGRATSQALYAGNPLNASIMMESADRPPKKSFFERLRGRGGETSTKVPSEADRSGVVRLRIVASRTPMGRLEEKFMRITIRIAMYPVALIIVNLVITVGDLYISSTGGIYSRPVFGLYIVYYVLYGARGCVFAAIGIFLDPCLWRGMQAAWHGSPANAQNDVPSDTVGALLSVDPEAGTQCVKCMLSMSTFHCAPPQWSKLDSDSTPSNSPDIIPDLVYSTPLKVTLLDDPTNAMVGPEAGSKPRTEPNVSASTPQKGRTERGDPSAFDHARYLEEGHHVHTEEGRQARRTSRKEEREKRKADETEAEKLFHAVEAQL